MGIKNLTQRVTLNGSFGIGPVTSSVIGIPYFSMDMLALSSILETTKSSIRTKGAFSGVKLSWTVL